MVACLEFTLAVIGESRCRLQDCLSPVQEILFADLEGADILPAGLEDRKPYGLDVIETVILIDGSQGVAHHLRILIGIHQNAEAVFEIDNVQHIVCDDHAVAGSEALRHPFGEIQLFLNQDQRIPAVLLCLLDLLDHIGAVLICAFIHLTVKVGQVLGRICRASSQIFLNLVLAKGMCVRALLGVRTSAVHDAGA